MMHLTLRRVAGSFAFLTIAAGCLALLPGPAAHAADPTPISPVRVNAAQLGFRDYIHWPADLDPNRFFPVSKVRPGMAGVGRTVFEGVEIEEFQFKVLGVAHNFFPESDIVWVRLDTPRLKDIGVVAGMSGSPVYIDGKMLGAIAYGYGFSKEPIAGITPIEQMIRVLNVTDDKPHPAPSGAIATNWAEARAVLERWKKERTFLLGREQARSAGLPDADLIPDEGVAVEPLGMTLQISSTNPFVLEQANRMLSPHGLRVVSGAGFSGGTDAHQRVRKANDEIYDQKPQVADGAALGVTLMQGSLILSGVGTITLVHGNRLVAFGHPMFGDGEVDFPMSTAVIFGIMPSVMRPFKLGEVFEEIGSVRQDRQPAVGGQIGYVTPKMPMTVRINAPDVGEDRLFEYEIVPDRNYGPYFAMIGWVEAIMSADRPGGPMTLESTLRIHLTRGRTLERHDLLSGDTMPAMITGYHLMDYLGNLLNNPFELVKIEKIEVEATLRQRLDFGVVVNARLDRDAYRPGETANLQVWLQRWRGGISDFAIPLRLPADLEDGEYELQLLDGSGRESLEFQLRPEIRRPIEINQVLEGLQIAYPSNQLYLVLLREIDGMALSGKALPELPGSVMTAMQVSAPAHKTVPITLEKILENRKTFSYEVGGMRSLPVRVNRRIPD